MPLSPELVENLAADLMEAYARSEERVIEIIGRAIGKDLDAPEWATLKLADLTRLRRVLQVIADDLSAESYKLTVDAINEAWSLGGQTVLKDLSAFTALEEAASKVTPNTSAISKLVLDAYAPQRPLHLAIVRQSLDAYRDVIRKATAPVILGADTRRMAAYKAMRDFSRKGITGFTDRGGRTWQLTSYSEMALRTVTARAVVDAGNERMQGAGIDLVIVSNAPQECKICRPFEGKILSLTTTLEKVVKAENPKTGNLVQVHISGSLEQARSKGLFHPNCRHSVSAYLPGLTKPYGRTADPQGDLDRQKLRYLERMKREALREKAGAIDEVAAKKAQARVRASTKKIIEHTDNTTAKRQRNREHLGPR